MILEPVILECPHCHLRSLHYEAMSGTIHQSQNYTDGKVDILSGAFAFNPFLIKCRSCQGFYFFHDAINNDLQKASGIETGDLEFEEYHLKADDYADCLLSIKEMDPERETELRILFWHSINDLIRRPAFFGRKRTVFNDVMNVLIIPFKGCKRIHPGYREYREMSKQKSENLQRLLTLLKTNPSNGHDHLMVEIYRELGKFREAKKHLKNISSGANQKFITFQHKLISRRDRFVRMYPF